MKKLFNFLSTSSDLSVNSWWVKCNSGSGFVPNERKLKCNSFEIITKVAVGDICMAIWVLFSTLCLVLVHFSYSPFLYYANGLVYLLSNLGDGALLTLAAIMALVYAQRSNRFSLVGPFAMLVIALAAVSAVQLTWASVSSLFAQLFLTIECSAFFNIVELTSPKPVGSLSVLGLHFSFSAWVQVVFGLSLFMVLFLAGRTVFLGTKSAVRRMFWQNRVIDQLVLLVMAVIFSVLLLLANNFLFLFLAWVGLNLSLYGLLAQFSFSLKAQEAAIKYFILGLISAGFFLFGIWLLYISYGSVEFSVLSSLVAPALAGNYSILAIWGSILILSVLLFKLSAFPFQAWALDVYEGSSWFALSVLVLLVKPVFIILLIKVLFCFSGFKAILGPIVFISGVFSLIVGTVGAAFQQKIKRFLSMSSISHIGFILILLGLDFSNFTLAINYLIAYLVSNFIVLAIVSSARISGPLYPVSRSVVYWSEMSFLNGQTIFRSPRTLAFSVALLSLAGLPPFLGFFTKLGFFSACISKLTVSSLIACMVGLLSMPIGVYNYLRIVRLLWIGDCSSYKNLFFVSILSNHFFNLVVAGSMCVLVFGGLLVC